MTVETSLIHDLPAHTVRRAVVSAMSNNVYLITSKVTGAQILIDAADDLPAINQLIEEAARDAETTTGLAMIATTHQHWDHVRALAELAAASGAPTSAGQDDAAGITAGTGVHIDQVLTGGGVLAVAGIELTTVHLRGHTPGSFAFVLQDASAQGDTIIFTGDSLFPGGVGNTDKDPARFTQLVNDVEERLFDVYPESSIVLPGHGDATTLGAERPALPQWRERGW